jgi:hypothetical protein
MVRNSLKSAAMFTLVLGLSCSTPISALAEPSSSPSPTPNSPESQSDSGIVIWPLNESKLPLYGGGLIALVVLSAGAFFWFNHSKKKQVNIMSSEQRSTGARQQGSHHSQKVTGADLPNQVRLLQARVNQLEDEVRTLTKTQDTLKRKLNDFEERFSQNPNFSSSWDSAKPSNHPPQSQGYANVSTPSPAMTGRYYPENIQYQTSEPQSGASWDSIVSTYNSNPSYWEKSAALVSETPDSLDRRRRNSTSTEVTLAESSNPNYWIVTSDSVSYWLVPKANFKVSGLSFDTLQALFNIQGQQSSRLKLLKPALVKLSPSQEWELAEKGDIQLL